MVAAESTVFVVDDDLAAREGIEELMRSVGLATRAYASAQDFLDETPDLSRACLLLDVRMPGMSGLRLQEELNRRGSQVPIIFLTGHGDIPMAVDALRKGAVDFIEKPAGGQYLLDKVYEAIKVGDRRSEMESRKQDLAAKVSQLTPREREVLGYVKKGYRVKSIALKMSLSRKTVDWHLAVIREKMAVDSTGELLLLFYSDDVPPAADSSNPT